MTLFRSLPGAALLALAALVPGCVLAAAAATGVAVSQEFIQNANSAYIPEDSRAVWDATKTVLTHLALDPIDVDEDRRAAAANIDGARITALVETWDSGQTKLSVGAKKYGFYQSEIADDVLNRIRRELQ